MNIWRLIVRELAHRKLNFLFSVLSVAIAVACLAGAWTLLRADERHTAQLLAQKQKEVETAGAELEEAMRKITLGLGFNILITPQDQDLNELHLEGGLSRAMPEEYVDRLAQSKIVTVNHLLPSVVKRLTWPEKNIPIILQGTRGEVPILHADPKKPLLDAVPPGRIVLGYHVQQRLNLQPEDKVTLLGRNFTVLKSHPERGTTDDSTVWIHLAQAQELLGMQNLIHAILALECQCAGERLPGIRREITGILPGTQVMERGPPALARAEARARAQENAVHALQLETASRTQIRLQHERFAAVLVPVVFTGCILWIGFLAFGNVRERRCEIGILRAIGYRSGQILAIFLGKAAILGLIGAILGYLTGAAIGAQWSAGAESIAATSTWPGLDLGLMAMATAMALLLAVFGSWIPALWAARQDPATVLQEG
jgi:putative ABC transport system permease protein